METLVPHNYQQKSAQNQTFSQQETMYLIDYWTQVYMKHLRLLTFVFTQPQDVEWTFYRAHLDEPTQVRDMRGEILPTVDHRPLVDAIPAEKWDEYCRNEENKRLEKEREEQEEAQRAKLKLEEEAAAAVQAAKDLELAQAEPALTILPPTLPCPPPPDPATLFASAPEPSHALTPSEIAQSLVSTIDMHITALMTHLDKCLEHQMGEMSRIVDTVTGDKDGGKKGGKEDKVKARTGTPAASEKGGEREKEARPPSSVKKSAKSAKAKK
ncbi:hypothetical protein DFJ77DRAFT_27668 [Powellomyces hirtus]|nr:hypothetical protein DFJ77DRAFT_27668 [Powellomyces hirtus]